MVEYVHVKDEHHRARRAVANGWLIFQQAGGGADRALEFWTDRSQHRDGVDAPRGVDQYPDADEALFLELAIEVGRELVELGRAVERVGRLIAVLERRIDGIDPPFLFGRESGLAELGGNKMTS